MPFDLAELKKNVFEMNAHVPPSGLGCFDIKCEPLRNELTVTVKVSTRFFDPQNAPIPLEVQARFKEAFTRKIPEFWNNKFKFTLTKKGFENFWVKPKFEVVETEIANAHYDLRVNNREFGPICVRTVPDTVLGDGPEKEIRGQRLSAMFQLKAIDANALGQAETQLDGLKKPVTIAFNGEAGKGGYSLAAMERLREVATDVNCAFDNFLEKPKIKVKGPGAKGKDVAKNVAEIMTRFGLVAEISCEGNGQEGFVSVEVDRPQLDRLRASVRANVAAFPQFAQYAVVHEYGHMLGLPDEYNCCGTNTVGILALLGLASESANEKSALENNAPQKQNLSDEIQGTQMELVKLCSAFGVPAPSFGRQNPSIMSTGHNFMHCHAVTVADALVTMTQDYATRKDWRIDVTN
ncbi:MAG: hypothetical protein U0Q16_23830 [Bryobacteraceae bacterium]